MEGSSNNHIPSESIVSVQYQIAWPLLRSSLVLIDHGYAATETFGTVSSVNNLVELPSPRTSPRRVSAS